jgi:hypothetical protein
MPSRRARLSLLLTLVAALLVCLPAPDRARGQGGAGDADRYFRVEVDPEPVPRGGWAVQGYVYSTHTYRVNGVRLQIDVLDGAGKVMHQVYGWVPGDVPAGGRAYFFVSVPGRGAAYRGRVLSYFLVSREAA